MRGGAGVSVVRVDALGAVAAGSPSRARTCDNSINSGLIRVSCGCADFPTVPVQIDLSIVDALQTAHTTEWRGLPLTDHHVRSKCCNVIPTIMYKKFFSFTKFYGDVRLADD